MRYATNCIWLLLCLSVPVSAGDDASLPAIQQIWLDTKETPSALGKGSWTIVPYDEFQKTLAQAEQLQRAQLRPPWLTDARYEAELTGISLVGKSTWRFHNPHTLRAWAKVQPWSIPLLSNTLDDLEKARSLDDGKGLAILIEPQSSESRTVSWQLAGEERPDGLWFSTAIPAAPLSSFSIALPAHMALESSSGRYSIAGPFPADKPGKQLWQLYLSGQTRSELQFVVRDKRLTSSSLSTEVKLDGDFVVTENLVRARYEMDFQRWHDRLRTVQFTLDDSATIDAVTLKQIETEQPVEWKKLATGIISISLPELVEQRARLLVQVTWKHQPQERIAFPMPHFPQSQLTRSILRIVANQSSPLIDWELRDYYPVQGPARPSPQGADIYTFQPRLLTGQQPPRSPLAQRLDRRSREVIAQDVWWRIGPEERLTVRCQLGDTWKQTSYFAWKVPTGWQVQDVVSEPADPSLLWSWHPKKLLEVQRLPFSKTEPRGVLLITLKQPDPLFIRQQAGETLMPTLEPVLPVSRWAGTYGISLDRTMLPPAVRINKALGDPTSPGPDPLWAKEVSVIDWCWNVRSEQNSGSLWYQPWPTCAHQQFAVKLIKQAVGWKLNYRVSLNPLAGKIVRWPVQFSSPVSSISWRASDNQPVTWKALSSTTGEFLWEEPLTKSINIEAQVDWQEDTPLPLPTSPLPFSGYVELPAQYELQGEGFTRATETSARWNYQASSLVQKIVATRAALLQFQNSVARTRVTGEQAETQYRTTVPAHTEPLILNIPEVADLITVLVQGKPRPVSAAITLEPNADSVDLKILYRQPLRSSLLLKSWQPTLPIWNMPIAGDTVHEIAWPSEFISWQASATQYQWIILPHLLSLVIFGLACLIVLVKLLKGRQFRLASSLLLFALGISSAGWAKDEAQRALVYILPGERGNLEGARVIVPASLWTRLQAVAGQREACQDKPWWIQQADVEASILTDRLRFTAKLKIRTVGNDAVTIPWQQSAPPTSVELDGNPLQPSFVRGPFGIQQISLRIPSAGQHDLAFTWEQQIQQSAAWQSVTWRWPGAPLQLFRVTNTSSSTYLKTGTGGIAIEGHSPNAVGFTRETTLFWPRPTQQSAANQVDVGVLWEHRPLVSIAHAVLRYQLEQPTSQLLLRLPANLHVKNINLVGELAALPSPRLRSWRVVPAGTMQQLVIDLQRPALGTMHLLLELPWQRRDSELDIPLAGVIPVGISPRVSIVGYLADGVEAQPTAPLVEVPKDEYAFLRPWLPSFSSLPASQITRLVEKGPAIRLQPLTSKTTIRSATELWLQKNDAEHRIQVEVEQQSRPHVLLQAAVDAGMTIESITGEGIASWYQTTASGSQPTRLQLWLDPQPGIGTARFQIIVRQSLERGGNRHWLLSWKQLHWLSALTSSTNVTVHAEQPDRWHRLEPSAELRTKAGPWQTASQLLEIIPSVPCVGQSIVLEEASLESVPTLTAVTTDDSSQRRWSLTTLVGQTLPAEVELIVKQGQLEGLWQFSSTVPLITRVSRTNNGDLQYTILFSKPASTLQIQCQTSLDVTGKALIPTFQFPRWPGLQSP